MTARAPSSSETPRPSMRGSAGTTTKSISRSLGEIRSRPEWADRAAGRRRLRVRSPGGARPAPLRMRHHSVPARSQPSLLLSLVVSRIPTAILSDADGRARAVAD